jgi:hypothetical protein
VTFIEIQRDIFRRTNKPVTPDAQTQTRIKAFINQRHRTLLTMPGLDQLRHATTTFSSVSGTARVALVQAVSRVDAVMDTVNNVKLTERPLTWLRTVDPQQNSGTPYVFIPVGYEYVAQQPSDASQIWAVSTSTSDTGILRIEGIRTGGYPAISNVTLTGTTAIQIGSFSDWESIDKVYYSAEAAGFISILEDSSAGTELAVIRIGAVRPYYFIILLWETPSGVVTYTMDYTREIRDMVEDTDEPYLPPDFHDLLSIGGRMDEYEKTDDGRFKTAAQEWVLKYQSLQYWLQGRASSRHIPRGVNGSVGWSDLGAWYPADVYR